MRAIILKLLLVTLLGAWAAPAAPAPQKVFPYAYSQDDLPNGLRLVTIPTDYPNIVSIYIVVQTGSRNEVEPGKTGFAHLFEHMMFRGTEKYPPEKYQKVLTQAGASSNASTTDDFTQYYTTFSKEDLEKVLEMEADRFQGLKYSEDVFRTESLAVLGEYNKNSANPTSKLYEVLQDTAFDRHTYKHTTMGFLKDIQDMPNQYQYSLQFFDRYYRPEYTTIIVAGDVTRERVKPVVEKYWGNWKRGSYKAEIPAEPAQEGPRQNAVKWAMPTLPWITIAYRMPAYSDTEKTTAALSILSSLAFSPSSDLYQKLVIREQKVDMLRGGPSMNADPSLFAVMVRVKRPADMKAVQDDILNTVKTFAQTPVSRERLEAVKSNLRYGFALSMSDSSVVAGSVARFVALRRTPETVNRLYDMYSQVTPDDVVNVAKQYLVERGQTIVTLTSEGR